MQNCIGEFGLYLDCVASSYSVILFIDCTWATGLCVGMKLCVFYMHVHNYEILPQKNFPSKVHNYKLDYYLLFVICLYKFQLNSYQNSSMFVNQFVKIEYIFKLSI